MSRHAKPGRLRRSLRWWRVHDRKDTAESLPQWEREDLVHFLHLQGLTDRQIADRIGESAYTTGRICDRLGLPPNRS